MCVASMCVAYLCVTVWYAIYNCFDILIKITIAGLGVPDSFRHLLRTFRVLVSSQVSIDG